MLAETLRFLLTGSSALVMHNSRLVDPLDPWSREIAAITGKRHKTIADHEQLAKAEFYGSAWLDHDSPCIPATVIEGLLVTAAKTRRRGSQARSGIASLVDAEAVEGWFKLGGELLGIGDFRPRHGRFSVERLLVVSPTGSVSTRSGRAGQASARQGSVESAGEEYMAPLPSLEHQKRKRKTKDGPATDSAR